MAGGEPSLDCTRRLPQASETHPFFGTQFRAPDCHTFWRNGASGCEPEQNALKPAAEFERFRIATFGSFGRFDGRVSGCHLVVKGAGGDNR